MKTIIIGFLILFSFHGYAQCERQLLYDDYSDATLWTIVAASGDISFTGGTLNYNNIHGGDYGRAFRPLPSTLPDTYWNATCTIMLTAGNGPAHYIMAFTSGTLDPISYDGGSSYALTDEDAITAYLIQNAPPSSDVCCTDPYVGSWNVVIRSKKGTILAAPSAGIQIDTLNRNYYVRLQRLSTSYVSMNIYSDSTMTTDLPGSPVYYCIDPTITGLNTVHQGVITWSGFYRILSAKFDNLAICLDPPAGSLAVRDSAIGATCTTPGWAFVTVTGGTAPYTITWNTSPVQHGDTATGLLPGTYTVTVSDASASCLPNSLIDTVVISEAPATTTTVSATICAGQTYVLPSGSVVSNSGHYTNTLTSSTGCDSLIITDLTVMPSISITSDATTVVSGTSIQLVASGAISYEWSPSAGLSCTSCANPIASPEETTKYCVTGSTGTCADSACITVTVESACQELNEIQMPDAFSPNNDGNNDFFLLQGWNACVKEFSIVIYDRWGEKIYESDTVNFSWDGSFKGKTLNPAVFVYYIHATLTNGRSIEQKGNITLIR